jgi:catechol 2,3-dioxygenase-like lactoylglutathione lyase family enzyme
MTPRIDHLQITVKNLDVAEKFYDKLMPILGFDLSKKSKGRVPANEFDVIEYAHKNLTIGFNSPREQFKDDIIHRRKPGAVHHLAFAANSKEEVDELAKKLKEIKVNIVDGPRLFPQHGENYYAVFFKDDEGIKYEIVFENRDYL